MEAVAVREKQEAVGPRGEGPESKAASRESPVYSGGCQTA